MSYSHLTAEEQYRQFGVVESRYIPELLDAKEKIDEFGDAGRIKEAIAQFPEEGFLDESVVGAKHIKDWLGQIHKSSRGKNRDELDSVLNRMQDLIDGLDRIQTEAVNAGAYGANELKTLQASLER